MTAWRPMSAGGVNDPVPTQDSAPRKALPRRPIGTARGRCVTAHEVVRKAIGSGSSGKSGSFNPEACVGTRQFGAA